MLYLVTGLPGASKTLNTIKWLSEKKDFQNRPIYYHNIKELTLPWVYLDDPSKWSDCPDGSIIVLDEAQESFPARGNNRPVPEFIELLAKHRHHGFDIIFITQHPNLIDVFVRRLIGNHTHYSRPFGVPFATKMTWPKCKDPDDFHAAKEAEKGTVKLDKKYFGVYKSAELHTHRIRIPKKIIFFIILIIISSFFAIRFYNDRVVNNSVDDQVSIPVESKNSSFPVFTNPLNSNSSDNELSFEESNKPRILGLPHTAPIYDHLTKPKTYPWPNCISDSKFIKCSCYSQQGTRMEIPHYRCKSIIENGLFNPYIDPKSHNKPAPTAKARSVAELAGGVKF